MSVAVAVQDEQGDAITDAEVVFSVDGGEEQACDGNHCGWEREGTFVVTARKAGYDDAQKSIVVGPDADGCHVESQTLTLTLTSTEP